MKQEKMNSEQDRYKERLELTLAGTNCGTWHHDFATNVVHYDQRAKKLLGINKSSLSFKVWLSIVHPEDIKRISTEIEKSLNLKKTHINIIYRVIVNNKIRYLKVDSFVKYKDGKPKTSYGLIQDITEAKNKEVELERINKELQATLKEIKTLRGVIPICSYCHKIRDTKGAWNQLEQYISSHSEAEFSHGIFPACLEKELKELKK